MAETTSSPSTLWTVVAASSAPLVALVVVAPILNNYANAYHAAPREITAFVEAVDCSIRENESYDCDIAKVTRLEDKMRLNQLLREIQRLGDDLREDVNKLVMEEGGTKLRPSTRVFWANHKLRLEERLRRIDMLRMRFLVVFMSIVATNAGERPQDAARSAPREKEVPPPPPPPQPPALPDNKRQMPVRRLTTQAMGHNEKTEHVHRSGWFGVVAELQRSPILRQRHASIEEAMRSPPQLSLMGSPSAPLTPIREPSTPERLRIRRYTNSSDSAATA
ncbi:hypothetical protein GGS20DRAFT_17936 [Poronia punctata]|nr:hypothetical protein GGS20DRAFT_17936 [Poronia punctata]